MKTIYESDKYLNQNPNYHQEDGAWKALQVIKMIKKHSLSIHEICEVGCGSGEILNQLYSNFSQKINYFGYDISSFAIDIAKSKENNNIHFYNDDFLKSDRRGTDLLLIMDVVEHVDNYIGFLKALKEKSIYKVFHFPIEMSCRHIVFIQSLLIKYRHQFGHLHHFSKGTAIETLKYCGYEIIDSFFTNKVNNIRSLIVRTLYSPLTISFYLMPELTVKLFGGFGLLVLAK